MKKHGRCTFLSPSGDNSEVNWIRIFSNPSTGRVYILFLDDIPEGTVISVVNAIGKEVLNHKLDFNPGVIDLIGNMSWICNTWVKQIPAIGQSKLF